MKKKSGFLLAVFLAICSTAPAIQTLSLKSSLGPEIEFRAESFEPGQIVLVRLLQGTEAEIVRIRFEGHSYELGSRARGLESFALVGLDLGLKPGRHVFDVSILGKDGAVEGLRQDFEVLGRDFPVKKLWVKEKYVTPPPEVTERIQWEAELLETIYSIVTPRWLAEGEFILPHTAAMTPNFGERRIYNDVPRSTHSGVDISAPFGSPVVASNSGRVVLARDLYFSGQTVIIDHGLGLFTYYCHFSSLRVKRGESVKKGDVVGLVGSTGRSTGPHLHWGVKVFDSRVDPLALLALGTEL
jgi:murein DD-endopeptidase MepM/ murein hydrolase activator NlpD